MSPYRTNAKPEKVRAASFGWSNVLLIALAALTFLSAFAVSLLTQ